MFRNISVLHGGFVSTSPKPKVGEPPLVGCPRLHIQFIRSYPPYRRPLLYLQPENAPWLGNMDPLHGLLLLLLLLLLFTAMEFSFGSSPYTRINRHCKMLPLVTDVFLLLDK